MRLSVLLLLALCFGADPLAAAPRPDPAPPGHAHHAHGQRGECVYRGAQNELAVSLPRRASTEVEVRLDGALDEPVWEHAAVLTDFTQFEPAEGAPASERTEVLVFYTERALYVGVRAYASDPQRLRATLADRDRIENDDHIRLFLDTFDDRRRAYTLWVNPLGIQQDGIYNEGAGGRRDEQTDFNPDFLFQSEGRLTGEGYVVELRIPFKSIKFAGGAEQRWGINVMRKIAASGAEEVWAPLSRDRPSRLEQSGTLVGIRDLDPGRLLEVTPVLTGKREGAIHDDDRFRRDAFEPDFGANLKYGVTSNFTLDATYNPDFSQVEADAGQITTNERFAIFFPEKRPFFLEGADIFTTPEPLVYTRSIVNPIAGAKLTGKVGRLAVGYLGAVDESPLAGGGFAPRPSRAVFNIARLQRDVGVNSSLGLLLTDREAADQFNRVAGVDGRLRFADLYTWTFQAAGSWTRSWAPDEAGADSAWVNDRWLRVAPENETGHLLQSSIDRTGRNFGFRFQAKDIPDAFRARSGFLRRTGVTDFFLFTRYTQYGEPGALVENWGPRLFANRIYGGRDFWHGSGPEEGEMRLSLAASLRGNNRVELGVSNDFYVLDPARYGGFLFRDAQGDAVNGAELIGPRRELSGLRGVRLQGSSSYFRSVSLRAEGSWKEAPIFAEGTRGEVRSVSLGSELRPTDALRVEADLKFERITRAADGSFYSRALVPRLKLEYQLTRAIFVRGIGQYSVEEVDLLRTPFGLPYLLDDRYFRVRGGRVFADEPQLNPLRVDLLFSYQPSPGTVLFLGYGRQMNDNEAFRFSPLEPRADQVFVKLSYLFRN